MRRNYRRLDSLAAHQCRFVHIAKQPGASRRGAAMLLEGVAGTIMVTAILIAVIPLSSQVQRQQRLIEQREVALTEAHSLLTELSGRPWDELTAGDVPLSISSGSGMVLTAAKVRGSITDHQEPPGKRLDVSIDWTPTNDSVLRTVQISTFVLKNGEKWR